MRVRQGTLPGGCPASVSGGGAGLSPAVSRIGMWRSLVAHLTGGQGVAGSNPVIPTNNLKGKCSACNPAVCGHRHNIGTLQAYSLDRSGVRHDRAWRWVHAAGASRAAHATPVRQGHAAKSPEPRAGPASLRWGAHATACNTVERSGASRPVADHARRPSRPSSSALVTLARKNHCHDGCSHPTPTTANSAWRSPLVATTDGHSRTAGQRSWTAGRCYDRAARGFPTKVSAMKSKNTMRGARLEPDSGYVQYLDACAAFLSRANHVLEETTAFDELEEVGPSRLRR